MESGPYGSIKASIAVYLNCFFAWGSFSHCRKKREFWGKGRKKSTGWKKRGRQKRLFPCSNLPFFVFLVNLNPS